MCTIGIKSLNIYQRVSIIGLTAKEFAVLIEDIVMIEMLVEAVLLSFVLGGIVGAVVALHLRSDESAFEDDAGFMTTKPVEVKSGSRNGRMRR